MRSGETRLDPLAVSPHTYHKIALPGTCCCPVACQGGHLCRSIRHYKCSLMQMSSSSASSTIGQPRRAAQYGRYPPAQM